MTGEKVDALKGETWRRPSEPLFDDCHGLVPRHLIGTVCPSASESRPFERAGRRHRHNNQIK